MAYLMKVSGERVLIVFSSLESSLATAVLALELLGGWLPAHETVLADPGSALVWRFFLVPLVFFVEIALTNVCS